MPATTYTPTRPIMSAAELRTHHVKAHGRDYRISDNGYDDMAVAQRSGWRTLASWGANGWDLGQWPYVSVQVREYDSGAYEIQTIVEGDHDRYLFDTREDRNAALDYLFLWYAAGESWCPVTHEQREALDRGEISVPDRFRGPYRPSN